MTRKLLAICLSSAAICVTATAPSFSRGHYQKGWCDWDPSIKLNISNEDPRAHYDAYDRCYKKTGNKRYCWNNSRGKVDCRG